VRLIGSIIVLRGRLMLERKDRLQTEFGSVEMIVAHVGGSCIWKCFEIWLVNYEGIEEDGEGHVACT
jgi:hypothetical protein